MILVRVFAATLPQMLAVPLTVLEQRTARVDAGKVRIRLSPLYQMLRCCMCPRAPETCFRDECSGASGMGRFVRFLRNLHAMSLFSFIFVRPQIRAMAAEGISRNQMVKTLGGNRQRMLATIRAALGE